MTEISHGDGDGLSPAARAALAALQAEDDMPAGARARVWDRLAEVEDLPERTGRRSRVVIGLALAAGVILAAFGVQRLAAPVAVREAAVGAQYDGESAGARAVERRGEAEVRAASVRAAVEEDLQEAEDVGPAEDGLVDRSPRTGRKRQVVSEARGETGTGPALGREAALLQQAQAALAGSRADEALVHLAAYDREFAGGGVLRPEHDALRVVALCAAGRLDEGRAAADRFLRAHAGSVQAERVRGACAAAP